MTLTFGIFTSLVVLQFLIQSRLSNHRSFGLPVIEMLQPIQTDVYRAVASVEIVRSKPSLKAAGE